MFKFTGITKDAGCGKPQHSKAKVLMVAAKSKPKKKIIKEGNFAKGAFIGKAVTKIKKSLEAGKKARTYRKNLRSVSNTLNKQVDAARLPSGG